MIALFLVNICEARADLPPEIWHCASQDNCIALLQYDDIDVYRKGVLKGTINSVGYGYEPGTVRVTNGWITVGRDHPDVHLYNIETGVQCTAYVEYSCTEGVVWLHPIDPTQDYAFFICPQNDSWVRVPLDCSNHLHISTNGYIPSSITLDEDRIYILSEVSGSIKHYSPMFQSGSIVFTNEQDVGPLRTDGLNSKLYLTAGDEIGTKTLPFSIGSDGNADPFYTLPSGFDPTWLEVSETHVLVSGFDGNDAYLLEIANPNNPTVLPISDSQNVALSSDTAYVKENATGSLLAFDMAGNNVYSLSQTALDIAYIKPTVAPVCPNGLIEPGETCDGTDFDGVTCQDYGFDGGNLSCSVSCDTIFTSGCWSCGDGTLNPGESCDGTDLGTASCQASGYENGEVTCNGDCTVNYDQCYTCGNGLIEGVEECEGADLNGETCGTAGFVDGTLACGDDCMFDTDDCHMCGNNITDAGETCDGTDTPGMICQTMGLGYTGGDLICDSVCGDYDDSGCYTCGDGNVDENEECDGANLDGQDCSTLGLGSGTLSCFGNCTFNLNECEDVPAEYCGNGIIDPGEECDDGNRLNSDDCSEFCKIIPPTCGLGGLDAGETCDGTDLGGETCQSQGYQSGVLYCGDDCQLRTDGCSFTSTPQTISLELDAEPESGELDESLQAQYKDLKQTLSPNCVSQDVNGDLVITTTQGSYCAVRATVLNKSVEEKMFSFIYLPENALEEENPVLRFYQNGSIAQNFGGHITAYQGLQVKTVLVQDRLYHVTQERIASMGMKFLALHPETNSRGRWLAVNIGTGSTSMCADETAENCAKLVPDQGQVIINLNALEDLTEIDWSPPKDGGGCSCNAHSSTPSNSLPLMFMFLLGTLLFWRRFGRLN